jgi:hypothetical protein
MNHCCCPFLVASAVLLLPSYVEAAEPSKDECIAANDAGQDLRRAGKLHAAHEKLAFCVSTSCPGPVREDCAQRLTEVDGVMPSLVFEAKDRAGSKGSSGGATFDGGGGADSGSSSGGSGSSSSGSSGSSGGSDGGSVEAGVVVTLATGQKNPGGIAVNAQYVAWTTCNTALGNLNGQGSIMVVSPDGGTPVALVTDTDNGAIVAVDDTHAYWFGPDDSHRRRRRTPLRACPTSRFIGGMRKTCDVGAPMNRSSLRASRHALRASQHALRASEEVPSSPLREPLSGGRSTPSTHRSQRHAGHLPPASSPPSSTARTFAVSVRGVTGFWRYARCPSRTPWRMMLSSV